MPKEDDQLNKSSLTPFSFSQVNPIPLQRDFLKTRTQEMLDCVTSPEFLEQLEAVRRLPPQHRIEEAAKRLTPDAIRAAGIGIPDGVRVSSRYFEEGEKFSLELGDTPGRIPVVPAIHKLQPDFLDKLRFANPELFDQLVGNPPDQQLRPTGACVCVGAGVCVGIGVSF